MDPDTIEGLQVNTDPVFVIPRAEKEKGLERGIPQKNLITINAGEQLILDHLLTIYAIPSAHESFRLDREGNHYFLGYVIDFQGLRCYHSGDSLAYPGLADELQSLDIHLAFLPVNGRDEFRRSRGIPGNMTLNEAIDLCKSSCIPHLICHHFGMFNFNTVEQCDLQKRISKEENVLDCLIPKIGETYTVWLNGIDEKGER
jgi:L-ascorbate metabolism protein UlaG (beta-lactamase superfamily)